MTRACLIPSLGISIVRLDLIRIIKWSKEDLDEREVGMGGWGGELFQAFLLMLGCVHEWGGG